jgi:hypothetical protein
METIAIITNYEVFCQCLRPTEIEHGFGNSKIGWELYYGFDPSNYLTLDSESKWDAWLEYLKHFRVYDQSIPEDSFLREKTGISPLEFQRKMVEISKAFGTFDNSKSLPVYALGMIEELGEASEVLESIFYRASLECNSPVSAFTARFLELSKNLGDAAGIGKRICRGDAQETSIRVMRDALKLLRINAQYLFNYDLESCIDCGKLTIEDSLEGIEAYSAKSDIERLKKEYADEIGYIVLAADAHGIGFQELLEAGVAKLEKRMQNNSLLGSGSDR